MDCGGGAVLDECLWPNKPPRRPCPWLFPLVAGPLDPAAAPNGLFFVFLWAFFSRSSTEEMEPVVGLSVRLPGVATMAVAWWSAGMADSLSDHLPVGVSSVRRSIEMATPVMRMKGTMKETRHATWGVRPRLWTLDHKVSGGSRNVVLGCLQ